MDYEQWLDVFWDAVRATGSHGHISQGFSEQMFLSGRDPKLSADEYCSSDKVKLCGIKHSDETSRIKRWKAGRP